MNHTMWLTGVVGALGIFVTQACGEDATTDGPPTSGPTTDAGSTIEQDGSTQDGPSSSGCNLAPDTETFGLTDATKLVSIVRDTPPTSLPSNARANTGRLLVDECGVRVLAELDGSYSIHTGLAGQTFTSTSTSNIDDIKAIGAFRKIGSDFAVLATTQDNKSYLYRMPASGGAITKVVSSPLLNGDFGAQSIAVSATHLFFSTYKAGPAYELRRTPIASFSTGTIPLEEPIATDSSDNAKEGIFLWDSLVAYGFKHYAQDCTPEPGTGCTADATTGTPNLRYVFAGRTDTLYGWLQGKYIVRSKSAANDTEVVPTGITTTLDESLMAGSVSPDGTRAAVLTQSSTQGYRLLLITNAKSNAPSATAFSIPDTDNVQDVWTNGKVALVMWARSSDTRPLAVYGIAWP